MTFKLVIGERLQRDEPAPSTQTASDLVRSFRKRLRASTSGTQPGRRTQDAGAGLRHGSRTTRADD